MPCVCGKDITYLDELIEESHVVTSRVTGFNTNIYGKKFVYVNYHTTKLIDDSEREVSRYYVCRKCGEVYETEAEVIKQFGGDT
jgi:hypothetical protein